jgi:hypothetical protein
VSLLGCFRFCVCYYYYVILAARRHAQIEGQRYALGYVSPVGCAGVWEACWGSLWVRTKGLYIPQKNMTATFGVHTPYKPWHMHKTLCDTQPCTLCVGAGRTRRRWW